MENTGQPDLQPDWPKPIFNPHKMTHFQPLTRLTRNPIDLARRFAMSNKNSKKFDSKKEAKNVIVPISSVNAHTITLDPWDWKELRKVSNS